MAETTNRSARDVALDILVEMGEDKVSREEMAHAAKGPGEIGKVLRRLLDAVERIVKVDRERVRAEAVGFALLKKDREP